MREEKTFVRWMVLLAFMFFGIAKGIPAALILGIPEPMPKLARVTEVAIVEQWEGPGDFHQMAMLDELNGKVKLIQMLALMEVGIYPEIKGDGCGQYQLDVVDIDGYYELRTANTGESRTTGGGIGP
jgi:hypothetical protein